MESYGLAAKGMISAPLSDPRQRAHTVGRIQSSSQKRSCAWEGLILGSALAVPNRSRVWHLAFGGIHEFSIRHSGWLGGGGLVGSGPNRCVQTQALMSVSFEEFRAHQERPA